MEGSLKCARKNEFFPSFTKKRTKTTASLEQFYSSLLYFPNSWLYFCVSTDFLDLVGVSRSLFAYILDKYITLSTLACIQSVPCFIKKRKKKGFQLLLVSTKLSISPSFQTKQTCPKRKRICHFSFVAMATPGVNDVITRNLSFQIFSNTNVSSPTNECDHSSLFYSQIILTRFILRLQFNSPLSCPFSYSNWTNQTQRNATQAQQTVSFYHQ